MPSESPYKNMQADYDHLFKAISSQRFLERQCQNNEVPFFIAPLIPAGAVEMTGVQRNLITRFGRGGIRVLEINLYDLSLNLLEPRSLLDRNLQNEIEWSYDQLKDQLQGVLTPEQHLIPAISERLDAAEFDVLFPTGVGEIHPYIHPTPCPKTCRARQRTSPR